MTQYNATYFLKKFRDIPEEDWTTGRFRNPQGQCCAMGHFGAPLKGYPQTMGLIHLTKKYLGCGPAPINDGKDERFPQPTPKQRMIAALNLVKEIKKGNSL